MTITSAWPTTFSVLLTTNSPSSARTPRMTRPVIQFLRVLKRSEYARKNAAVVFHGGVLRSVTELLLLLHGHIRALCYREQIRLSPALAEDLDRSAELRIVAHLAALFGGVTESNTSDARAEQPVDLGTAGLELRLVDFDALGDESVIELIT